MKVTIQQALRGIEEQEQIYILYACESGSRAWGFASHNSDYDVRFLYVRPQSAYLRLDMPRDVIEQPIVDDLDINGWDIFKALRLLRKSNPPLLEWLLSPIVYRESSPAIAELRTIAYRFTSPAVLYYHYSRMASRNYHEYIQREEVILKKYLYVLRPLTALLFLEQHNVLPPTSFLETLAQVELASEIRLHIHELIARKQAGDELGKGVPDGRLNTFIEEQLEKWYKQTYKPDKQEGLTDKLEQVLKHILVEKPGDGITSVTKSTTR
ncbi:MAG TPA: nucleotidyltransferase domain-containing protein [Ktedonobacteraceae bacterium]|jgi:hypothetical protein